MKKKKHISAGRVTVDDVVSAIRFQDIYPEDFNTRRRKYEAVLSAIDDALEGWKVPREVLSREQEAWLAAYVRRLVKRRDKVAAKLIQIRAEEDNFDAVISSSASACIFSAFVSILSAISAVFSVPER